MKEGFIEWELEQYTVYRYMYHKNIQTRPDEKQEDRSIMAWTKRVDLNPIYVYDRKQLHQMCYSILHCTRLVIVLHLIYMYINILSIALRSAHWHLERALPKFATLCDKSSRKFNDSLVWIHLMNSNCRIIIYLTHLNLINMWYMCSWLFFYTTAKYTCFTDIRETWYLSEARPQG